MDWKHVATAPCPVSSALELFGDRWSVLIIRDVMNGVRRFDELVDRLSVSRATLSDRLRRLVQAQILVPSEYLDGRGRHRTEYRLTERGWDLRLVLIALREWGDKHVLGEGNEPLRLVDGDSGRDLRLGLIDPESGEVVDPAGARLVPGPALRLRDDAGAAGLDPGHLSSEGVRA